MIASIVALSILMLSAWASLSCYELVPGTEQQTVALDDCLNVLNMLMADDNFFNPTAFINSTNGGYGVTHSWHFKTCKVEADLTKGYAKGQISRADIAKTAVAILRTCTIPSGEANIGGQATAGAISEFLVSLGAFKPFYKSVNDGRPIGLRGPSPRPHGIKRSQKIRTM